MDTAVKIRKCRRHYGTSCSSLFQKAKHRAKDAYICPFTGDKRASNQMNWLLRKGQNLPTSSSEHGTLTFNMDFWVGKSRKATVELLAANGDQEPRFSDEPVSTHQQRPCDTKYSLLKGVFEIAKLVVDLSGVPERLFRKKRSKDGRTYHMLSFEVNISVQSALEYSFSVEGVKYGSVQARYE
jgi:hypothetical protein